MKIHNENKIYIYINNYYNLYIYKNVFIICLCFHNPETFLMCSAKSKTLLEYPHSLSYQETSLWKLSFKPIPALASKIDDLSSCIKSDEAT